MIPTMSLQNLAIIWVLVKYDEFCLRLPMGFAITPVLSHVLLPRDLWTSQTLHHVVEFILAQTWFDTCYDCTLSVRCEARRVLFGWIETAISWFIWIWVHSGEHLNLGQNGSPSASLQRFQTSDPTMTTWRNIERVVRILNQDAKFFKCPEKIASKAQKSLLEKMVPSSDRIWRDSKIKSWCFDTKGNFMRLIM